MMSDNTAVSMSWPLNPRTLDLNIMYKFNEKLIIYTLYSTIFLDSVENNYHNTSLASRLETNASYSTVVA